MQPERLPVTKCLLVAQQHVAAGFEIIALLDAGAGDRLAELHRVALVDKGHIVDDEDPGFADAAEVLDHPIRAQEPVAAAVKGPGAAKRAVPWAAARELDRSAGVENAQIIFAAMTHEVARRHHVVERMDKARRRPFAFRGDGAGDRDRVMPGLDRGEQQRDRSFALALEHAVDGAFTVLDQRICGKRGAMPADADEHAGKARLGGLGEIDDFGNVRQVVAAEGDGVGLPALDRAEIGALVLDLEIEQAHRMAGLPRRRGDELEADRLEPQEYLRIGHRAGMDAEQPHQNSPSTRRARVRLAGSPASIAAYCEAEPPRFPRVPRNMIKMTPRQRQDRRRPARGTQT